MTEHPPEFTDTDPAAMEVWLDLLRRMPAGEKLAAALQLSGLALKLSEAGERAAHPAASDHEIFLRAAARRLPRDLMIRVYHWDPEANGDTL
jgi:hypothetical protein